MALRRSGYGHIADGSRAEPAVHGTVGFAFRSSGPGEFPNRNKCPVYRAVGGPSAGHPARSLWARAAGVIDIVAACRWPVLARGGLAIPARQATASARSATIASLCSGPRVPAADPAGQQPRRRAPPWHRVRQLSRWTHQCLALAPWARATTTFWTTGRRQVDKVLPLRGASGELARRLQRDARMDNLRPVTSWSSPACGELPGGCAASVADELRARAINLIVLRQMIDTTTLPGGWYGSVALSDRCM
jgi:hypothetical protein